MIQFHTQWDKSGPFLIIATTHFCQMSGLTAKGSRAPCCKTERTDCGQDKPNYCASYLHSLNVEKSIEVIERETGKLQSFATTIRLKYERSFLASLHLTIKKWRRYLVLNTRKAFQVFTINP